MYENYDTAESVELGGAMFDAFGWFVILAVYFYFTFMHYKMAQKSLHSEIAFWAFIPILNTILLIKMAEKPMWWFILLLVPFVNIFCFFALWMSVAKAVGQSPVWGFLVMIPIINFVALFVLAFGSSNAYMHPSESVPPTSPEPPTRPRDKTSVS